MSRWYSARAALIFIAALGLLGGATGCATSRGILNIHIPSPANPTSGVAYKIVDVKDSRSFELKPPQPFIPSLKNGEINDRAITSRAIARKRNGYGMALGDILLPEGDTVQDLTERAVARAFRETGLRVIAQGDPQWDEATPVEVDIQQLWAWMTPGFWSIGLDFDMRVRIKTDLGFFQDGDEAHGNIQLRTQAAGTRAWLNTINKGLEEFNRDLKSKLALALNEK